MGSPRTNLDLSRVRAHRSHSDGEAMPTARAKARPSPPGTSPLSSSSPPVPRALHAQQLQPGPQQQQPQQRQARAVASNTLSTSGEKRVRFEGAKRLGKDVKVAGTPRAGAGAVNMAKRDKWIDGICKSLKSDADVADAAQAAVAPTREAARALLSATLPAKPAPSSKGDGSRAKDLTARAIDDMVAELAVRDTRGRTPLADVAQEISGRIAEGIARRVQALGGNPRKALHKKGVELLQANPHLKKAGSAVPEAWTSAGLSAEAAIALRQIVDDVALEVARKYGERVREGGQDHLAAVKQAAEIARHPDEPARKLIGHTPDGVPMYTTFDHPLHLRLDHVVQKLASTIAAQTAPIVIDRMTAAGEERVGDERSVPRKGRRPHAGRTVSHALGRNTPDASTTTTTGTTTTTTTATGTGDASEPPQD